MLTVIAARARGMRAAYLCALFGILTVALAADAPAQLFTFSQTGGSNGASNNNNRTTDPFNSATGLGGQVTGANAANSQVSAGSSESNQGFTAADLQGHNTAQNTPHNLRDQEAGAETSERSILRPVQPPSEFETYVSTLANKPLRRFGAELLIPNARNFTPPPTTAVPPDYRLNPGDQLILGFTGSTVADGLRLTIDPDGRIFIPRVGSVQLAGVRYSDARDVIAQQTSRFYRNFNVSVAMGQLHGITVYVTGFAATPGSYTVSSLSTLVNAVLAAGGPSAGGSFRSIQLRRNGQLISDFDLYDLLLKGDKSADRILENGDIIYIAPAGPQLAVIGSVNHEAIFEAAPNDSIETVLSYAGGANTVADDSRLLVLDPLRAESVGWETLNLEEAHARIAKRGEIVRVLSGVGIARPLRQQPVLVTISGEVARPGRYYFHPGVSIADLLEKAGGLTSQAYPFASVLTRESVLQQQRISYNRAVSDLQLLLTTQPLVSAERNERLQPAALDAVQSVVQQLSARQPDGRIVLNLTPEARMLPTEIVLENNDTLYVPPKPVTVGVFGSVPSPASFRFEGVRKIRDYLALAGGVQSLGDKSGIFVIRANGSVISNRHHNLLGQRALPGDLIFVPIDANRGEFWARLRDITSTLFSSFAAAASVKVLTE